MEKFQTIIVGAGPAGLSCAKHLAENGVKVLVLERHGTIGPKVCAGGIPFRAQKELQLPEQLIQKSFPVQQVRTPWQQASITAKEPIIITINRHEFGQWMLAEALQAGAIVHEGTTVLAIDKNTLRTKRGSYRFDFLVGADGSSSIVRRFLNLPTKVIGVGINHQVPTEYAAMEWHLDPARFRSGYAWIFPHRHTTSIGIYAERTNLPPQLMKNRFLEWTKHNAIDLHHSQPRAALINFDYRGWRFDGVFLAGDAAGLASGFTGEGIYPAIVSGETVAKTILNQQYEPAKLNAILRQHKRHQQIQKFFCQNKVICQISMEMLILALKFKLIGFEKLEMY